MGTLENFNPFSIGHTALESHGRTGIPVVTLNYVGPEHRLPLPYPEGDSYLRQTAVPASREGEIVVCSTLIPGLLDYYLHPQINLLSVNTQIIEVEQGDGHGFPSTDPLERLRGHVVFDANGGGSPTLTSTFSGESVAAQARSLGIDVLDRPESSIMNDKAFLRRKAEMYGIRMLPGMCIDDWDELSSAVERFGQLKYGVWLKASTGSGGDLVRHIESITVDNLLESREIIREAVAQSFMQGKFASSMGQYWAIDQFSPVDSALIIESDARNHGELIVNGSTQFVTKKSGAVDIKGHYKVITSPEGEYLGNVPFHPSIENEGTIRDQVYGVGRLSLDEKNYGIQGADWFLIRMPNGVDICYTGEWNSRPTANTPPVIMADKLGVSSWINTNAYADVPIRSIEDYVRVVGEDLAFGDPLENGLVVPQAFRSVVTRRGVEASPNFKILITGRTADHCDTIAQVLSERGVRFTP